MNISADPDPGYRFSHWERNGATYSEILSFTHTISGDLELTAVFVPQNFTVSIDSQGGGSVSVLDANGSDANEFLFDSEYFIFLSQNEHYQFSGWTGDTDLLNNDYDPLSYHNSITVREDLTLTAQFTEMSYRLNIFASEGASYISPSSGEFGSLQTVTLTTSPTEGYTFLQWQDPYDILTSPYSTETDANISKIAYVDDAYVSALFEPTRYEIGLDINITSQQGGQINREDIQYYQHFQTYELNASPNAGYSFDSWVFTSNDSQLVYPANTKDNKLLIEGPLSLEATFEKQIYSISIIPSSQGSHSISQDTFTLDDNNSITLEANSHFGWEFRNWTEIQISCYHQTVKLLMFFGIIWMILKTSILKLISRSLNFKSIVLSKEMVPFTTGREIWNLNSI